MYEIEGPRSASFHHQANSPKRASRCEFATSATSAGPAASSPVTRAIRGLSMLPSTQVSLFVTGEVLLAAKARRKGVSGQSAN
jgi:hypothetical protein